MKELIRLPDDVYQSRYAGYQILVQGAEPIYAPGTGTMIGRSKELTAEFGRFGPEVNRTYFDTDENRVKDVLDEDTGAPMKTAVILGGVFDLQQQAEEKGWSAAETELVRQKVEFQCSLTPNDVWRRVKARPVVPWPTYERMHHNQVAEMASQLGLVGEALAYEREREKPRGSVVEKLEGLLPQPEPRDITEEMTVA